MENWISGRGNESFMANLMASARSASCSRSSVNSGRIPASLAARCCHCFGGAMLHKKSIIVVLAVMVALSATPIISSAQQAQGGQQPPADGQRRGGRGRGGDGQAAPGGGQAAPQGDGQGRGQGAGRGDARRGGRGAAQPMAIEQVRPGVYMVTNNGGNSTVRVTEQGIILVDTKNLGDMFYNELLAQIKTASPQPVKYAIVTHVHQDHAGNIERFEKAG